jgi:tryptophan synthase alpha chain
MTRLDQLTKGGLLKVLTRVAGDPQAPDLVKEIQEGDFDLLDLVVPFSDPAADSPLLEAAQGRALARGISMDQILDLIRQVRESSQVPLIISSYLNPLFRYGYPAFFQACKSLGVDGLLILDLPFEEREEVLDLARAHGVHLIVSLVPASPPDLEVRLSQAGRLVQLVLSGEAEKDRPLEEAVKEKANLAFYQRP